MWPNDWRRFVPETVLICAAIVAIDIFYLGDTRFADWQYSPLWIPVLLAACQYGLMGGAFAAAIASLSHYAVAMPLQGPQEDFYDYASRIVLQPAAWLGMGLALGSLRSLHIQKAVKADSALREHSDHLSHLVLSLKRATVEISSLESRIAGDTATVNRLLRGVAGADLSNSENLADSMAALIADTLAASSFTLYRRADRGLKLALVVDEEGARHGNPAVISAAAIETIAANQRAILRNDSAAAGLLPPGALLLAPVIGANGTLLGALLVERVRTTANTMPALAERATNLARVIGLLFELIDQTTPVLGAGLTLNRLAPAAREA